MPSRATPRLRVWTQFVGRLGFRINLASLLADLSIATAYLTVIYREKALPNRGEFESRDGNEKLYLVRTEQAACRF